jgi:hypothetical protein
MRFSAFVFLIGLMGFLCLAGCAGPATKTYTFIPPETPGGRLCTGQCQEAQSYCQETCDLHNRQCVGKVQAKALEDYEKYTRDQFESHEAVELRPRDFERTDACDSAKKSCESDCQDNYKVCYGNCGGKITMTTSCQFLCY